MAITINVNGLSLCHKGSGGSTTATLPDVCKSPSTPVPYPNIAFSSDLIDGTTTVLADGGNMCANFGSQFYKSIGDEPGVGGGVISSTFMKEATWITFSFDVKLEGKAACRLTDKMFQNHQNTVDMAGELQQPLMPGDPCNDLLQQIQDFMNNLKKRYWDLKDDKLNLPQSVPDPARPGVGTIDGHQQQFQGRQQGLRNRLQDWDTNKCGPPPAGAWDWATRPTPSPDPKPAPPTSNFDWGKALLIGGVVVVMGAAAVLTLGAAAPEEAIAAPAIFAAILAF